MPDIQRRNTALWAGFALIVVALLSQGLYFTRIPGQHVFPWINLALAGFAVFLLVIGLVRAFRQPQVYRGKISGSILTVVALAVLVFTVTMFVQVRNMPASPRAPQVGQKAPDFTLTDANGQQVSLTRLLSTPIGNAQPKAALLVFYRGYW